VVVHQENKSGKNIPGISVFNFSKRDINTGEPAKFKRVAAGVGLEDGFELANYIPIHDRP
jgi:hypothetical protein